MTKPMERIARPRIARITFTILIKVNSIFIRITVTQLVPVLRKELLLWTVGIMTDGEQTHWL